MTSLFRETLSGAVAWRREATDETGPGLPFSVEVLPPYGRAATLEPGEFTIVSYGLGDGRVVAAVPATGKLAAATHVAWSSLGSPADPAIARAFGSGWEPAELTTLDGNPVWRLSSSEGGPDYHSKPGGSAVSIRLVYRTGTKDVSAPAATAKTATLANVPAAMLAPTAVGGEQTSTLTFSAAPSDRGDGIDAYRYRVALSTDPTFSAPIAYGTQPDRTSVVLLPQPAGTYIWQCAARNRVGWAAWSPASAPFTVTAAAAAAPLAFAAGDWSIEDQGAAGGGQARIRVFRHPADRGHAITAVQYRIGAGAWTNLPGTSTALAPFVISGFTNGVAANVELRAVNAQGAGAVGPAKSVTTSTPAVASQSSVTFYPGTSSEITVTFSAARPVRQWADGQWAVQGPVTVLSTTPASAATGTDVRTSSPATGRWINGAQVNPGTDATEDGNGVPTYNRLQGFDQRDGDNGQIGYSHALNRDPGALGASLTLAAGDVFVKARHRPTPAATGRELIQNYAILEVVAELPPPGSLRPPLVSPDGQPRESRWKASDIDLSRLPDVAPVAGQPAYATALANMSAGPRTQWFTQGDSGRSLASWAESRGQSGYAAYIAKDWLDAALICCTNAATAAEKRALLTYVVQMGLDAYGRVNRDGALWDQKGALYVGRKLPHVLAATLLGDPALAAGAGSTPSRRYAEDRGIFTVAEIDLTRSLATETDPARPPRIQHQTPQLGWPDWGEQAISQPNRNNASIDAIYREIWDGCVYRATLAANLIEGARAVWGYEPTFHYIDRAHRWLNTGYRSAYLSGWVKALYNQSRDLRGVARWTPAAPEQAYPPRQLSPNGNRVWVRPQAPRTEFTGGADLLGYEIRFSTNGGSTWTQVPGVIAPASFPYDLNIGVENAATRVQMRMVTTAGAGPWSPNTPSKATGALRGVVTTGLASAYNPVYGGDRIIPYEIDLPSLEGWWRADVPTYLTLDGGGLVQEWRALYGADLVGRPMTQPDAAARPSYDAEKGLVWSPGGAPGSAWMLGALSGSLTTSWTIIAIAEAGAFQATSTIEQRFGVWGSANNRVYVEGRRVTGAEPTGDRQASVCRRLNGASDRRSIVPEPYLAGETIALVGRHNTGSAQGRIWLASDPDSTQATDTNSGTNTVTHMGFGSLFVSGARDTGTNPSLFRFRHLLLFRESLSDAAAADIISVLP